MPEAIESPAPDAPANSPQSPGDDATATLERLVWQQLRECYDPEIPVYPRSSLSAAGLREAPAPSGAWVSRTASRVSMNSLILIGLVR